MGRFYSSLFDFAGGGCWFLAVLKKKEPLPNCATTSVVKAGIFQRGSLETKPGRKPKLQCKLNSETYCAKPERKLTLQRSS